ncbi:MAG: sterol desaturase family protein [Chloroflexi bacterium]|nr:sterol desaturase family protein [Chloroflexota bacterium]
MKEVNSSPAYGSFDKRGHWKPPYPAQFSPLFDWPLKPKAILKSLFGFPGLLWPFNALVLFLSWLTLVYFQPAIETSTGLEFSWIGMMLLRNLIIMLITFGGTHLAFYRLRLKGSERKYNPSFQEKPQKKFLFSKQIPDNVFRSIVYGLPIWTAYEVLYIWAAANGRVPYLSFQENPIWFMVFFFVIVLFRDTHFYFVHRLIHGKLLFKYVHSVHHLNPNPGPWSGLSMHPIEHLLYYSGALIHFIIPSHPLHYIFHTQHLSVAPIIGHLGFEGISYNGKPLTSDYFHYLHHKHVTCNFGSDIVPWDRWLGVYFDGVGEYQPRKLRADKPPF